MQAGKDVYIEKPISHVFHEGPLIIAAAKKYGRVVQQGSQMRSSPVTAKAGRLLQEGIIGQVKVARAWTAETRTVEKPLPDGTPAEQEVSRAVWLAGSGLLASLLQDLVAQASSLVIPHIFLDIRMIEFLTFNSLESRSIWILFLRSLHRFSLLAR